MSATDQPLKTSGGTPIPQAYDDTEGAYAALLGDGDSIYAADAASATARGLSMYRNAALAATPQLVKAGRANLYAWQVGNLDGDAAYLQLYDAAAAADVIVGTTTPRWSVPIFAGGILDAPPSKPLEFALGLVVAVTSTPTGSAAPSPALLCNLGYR